MKTTRHLPADVCRCAGEHCGRKAHCLRHITLDAQRTPWTARYCPHGREAEGYIAVRREAA